MSALSFASAAREHRRVGRHLVWWWCLALCGCHLHGEASADGDGTAGAGGDAGVGNEAGAGGDAGATALPEPVASKQSVDFVLHNGSTLPMGVRTDGYLCSAFGIYRLQDGVPALVNREIAFTETLCSRNGDDQSRATYRLVPAGETLTLTWDAREEALFYETLTCPTGYPYDRESVQTPVGVARPAPAGDYQVVLGVVPQATLQALAAADAATCSVQTSPTEGYLCNDELSDGSTVGHECLSNNVLPVAFQLPQSGDVTVSVELGELTPASGG